MLLGCGEPDPVVFRVAGLVAEDEDNLVPDVNREAAEHVTRGGRQRSERIEHKFMRDSLALLDGEESVLRREKNQIAR
jgi:hypothetical protein